MIATYWYQDRAGKWRRESGCDFDRAPDRAPAGQLVHVQDGPRIGGDDYWLDDQGRTVPSPLEAARTGM